MLAGYTQLLATAAPSTSRINTPSTWSKPQHDAVHRKGRTPESGPRARPMEACWVEEVRDRCIAQNVAFFFKQWGGRTPKSGGRVLDGKTWDEWPVHPTRAAVA